MADQSHTAEFDAGGPWGEVYFDPGDAGPDEPCACGCPPNMHIGEIGCPCASPGEPPCVLPPGEWDEEADHG